MHKHIVNMQIVPSEPRINVDMQIILTEVGLCGESRSSMKTNLVFMILPSILYKSY